MTMKVREFHWSKDASALAGALCILSLFILTGCRTATPKTAVKPSYSGLMSSRGIVPPAASHYSAPRVARPVVPAPEVVGEQDAFMPEEPMVVPEGADALPMEEEPVNTVEQPASYELPHLENGRAVPNLAGAPANKQGVAAGAAAAGGQAAAGNNIYVVKSGDSLSRIAAAHKVKVADIMALNPSVTSPDKIIVGQRLTMPATATGDGLEAAPVRAEVPNDGIYTVAPGDSLWTIGKRFGVRREDIKAWNNLTDDKLRVGQQLRLRADAAQPTGNSAPPPKPSSASPAPAKVESTPEADPAAANTELPVDPEYVPIPTSNETPSFPYYVQSGDTLEKIAQRNNTTVEDILARNPGIKSDSDLVPNVTQLSIAPAPQK